MTCGNADRLKKVADALLCVKCQTNPKFASLQRCKRCLQADAAVERAARERLVSAQAAKPPTRQQAAALSAVTRKARATKPAAAVPAGKALVPARPTQPVPTKRTRQQPPRPMGEPFSVKQWLSMVAEGLKRWLSAKPAAQSRVVGQSMAAELVVQNTGYATFTYGSVPQATFFASSNAALSNTQWATDRLGVRIRTVDVLGDINDRKQLCSYCHARVREPCSESRGRSCPNRSRGNR